MKKLKVKIIDKKSKYYGKTGTILMGNDGKFLIELPDKEIFQYGKDQVKILL